MRLFIPIFVLLLSVSFTSCSAQKTKSAIYAPQQFMEEFAAEDTALIIDVRTPAEFAEGHIEGAINIDYYNKQFDANVDTLKRDIPLYIYCSKGGRSYKASRVFADKRFEEVYDLSGGFTKWKSAEMPVAK